MVRFLHSADWQIGLKASHVAKVADTVREARLDAARAVIAAANRAKVHAVLLAGDIFEDNLVSDRLVSQIVEILAVSEAPVYLLPGNHDALTEDSVYRRPSFAGRPSRVVLLESTTPIAIPGTDAVLLPSPAKQKKSFADPTAVLAKAPEGAIAVAIAHGSLKIEGKFSSDDFPIALDACKRLGLDYLAMGHWHGSFVQDGRAAYCGTHETTKFGEDRSGQAFLVEIAAHGALPQITEVPTGKLRWVTLECDLSGGSEAAAGVLRDAVTALLQPKQTLLRIRTRGQSDGEANGFLRQAQEELAERLCHVCLERGDVPAAVAQGRIAEVKKTSPLVSGLLEDLSVVDGGDEATRQAARRLLDELVLEEWR